MTSEQADRLSAASTNGDVAEHVDGTPARRIDGAAGLRVPDFFVVGHPKCGTTALYEMLMGHPQIFMPSGKEPWFFARELLTHTPPRPTGTPRTLEDYVAWFDGAGPQQLIGEASAMYLWSQVAAAGIAEANPDARIIAFLREPASFLRSLHLEWVQIYVERELDFERAIALEPERREGKHVVRRAYWPQALMYSDYVRYTDQLRRFHAVFPRDQVLVLIYDDFRRSNEETLEQVLRFLDVDNAHPIEVRESNPTVQVRSLALQNLMHSVLVGHGPVSGPVKAAVKAVTPTRLRKRAFREAQKRLLYTEPEPADERFMNELRRRFKPEVEAVSEYLGRDLVSLWGYDRLG